jgi:hypothetical protein
MKTLIKKVAGGVLIAFVALGIISCSMCSKNVMNNPPAPAPDPAPDFKKSLPQGTTAKDVEDYLHKLKIDYSFDKFTNAYYVLIKGQQGFISKDTQIIIKLDKDQKVSEVSVAPIYTGP